MVKLPSKPKPLWAMIPDERLDEIADLARQILAKLPRRKNVAVRKRRRVIRKRKP